MNTLNPKLAARLATDRLSSTDEVQQHAECATLVLGYGMSVKFALNLEAEHVPPRKAGSILLGKTLIDGAGDVAWLEEAREKAIRPKSASWPHPYEGFLFPWVKGTSLTKYLKTVGAELPVAKQIVTITEFKPTIPLTELPMPKVGSVGIDDMAICLLLEFGTFGNTRQVSMKNIDVKDSAGNVDDKIKKSRMRAQKRLLESPELEAIRSFDRRTKQYIRQISLPYDIGVDMVAYAAVPAINDWLDKRARERSEVLIPAFVAAYPKRCEGASKELGSQHNPKDYPPAESVAADFVFRFKWFQSGLPGKLKQIKADIFKKETEKAQAEVTAAIEQMQLALREAMLELVQHMRDCLAEDVAGKPKTFHASSVMKLVDFLGNVEVRNFTNDKELGAAVKIAKEILIGVNVSELKDIGTVRAKVKDGITQLATQLSGLVVNRGRRFSFDDDVDETAA